MDQPRHPYDRAYPVFWDCTEIVTEPYGTIAQILPRPTDPDVDFTIKIWMYLPLWDEFLSSELTRLEVLKQKNTELGKTSDRTQCIQQIEETWKTLFESIPLEKSLSRQLTYLWGTYSVKENRPHADFEYWMKNIEKQTKNQEKINYFVEMKCLEFPLKKLSFVQTYKQYGDWHWKPVIPRQEKQRKDFGVYGGAVILPKTEHLIPIFRDLVLSQDILPYENPKPEESVAPAPSQEPEAGPAVPAPLTPQAPKPEGVNPEGTPNEESESTEEDSRPDGSGPPLHQGLFLPNATLVLSSRSFYKKWITEFQSKSKKEQKTVFFSNLTEHTKISYPMMIEADFVVVDLEFIANTHYFHLGTFFYPFFPRKVGGFASLARTKPPVQGSF